MHPLLFHIFWIEIQTNVILLFFWIIFSGLYLENKIKTNKLLINFLSDYFFSFVFIFLLIWRIWAISLKWDIYKNELIKILYFFDWNFSFYLWIIWAWIFLFILTYIKKEDFWKWLDALIFPFLFLLIFISFWDLMSWENYWKPNEWPFPLSYTFNSPELIRYAIPIYPVQLYEAVSVLFILWFVAFFWRKKRISWIIALFWFSLFFLAELLLEFLRASSDTIIFWYKFHIILFWFLFLFSSFSFIFKSHRNFYFHTHN